MTGATHFGTEPRVREVPPPEPWAHSVKQLTLLAGWGGACSAALIRGAPRLASRPGGLAEAGRAWCVRIQSLNRLNQRRCRANLV